MEVREEELEETKEVEVEYQELQEKYLNKTQLQHKQLNRKGELLKLWAYTQILRIKIFINSFPLKVLCKNA